jgi:FkbH-like protein
VPNDIALFPQTISSFRLFDQEHISEEDRVRSEMMIQERERKCLSVAMGPDEFRKALGLIVEIFECRPEHVARVTQLINKTNQFNLTTRRKTAAEVVALCDDASWDVLAIRVADRFGDYGLVGVVLLHRTRRRVEIETLLLSCRVLGRGVEEAIFAKIAEIARNAGAHEIVGEYIPTKKNAMVSGLYKAHHYLSEPGGHRWITRDLSAFVWPEHIQPAMAERLLETAELV